MHNANYCVPHSEGKFVHILATISLHYGAKPCCSSAACTDCSLAQGCPTQSPPCCVMWPMTTFVNYTCIHPIRITQELRQLGMPFTVIFTDAADEPAHNNDCDPVTKKAGHPRYSLLQSNQCSLFINPTLVTMPCCMFLEIVFPSETGATDVATKSLLSRMDNCVCLQMCTL